MALIIGVVQPQLDFVKQQLALRTREEWFEVAEGSGVPFSTVKKIGYGQTKMGRADTIGLLYEYLIKHRRRAPRARNGRSAVAA